MTRRAHLVMTLALLLAALASLASYRIYSIWMQPLALPQGEAILTVPPGQSLRAVLTDAEKNEWIQGARILGWLAGKAVTFEKVIPLLKASCEEKRFREINKEMSVRVGKSPYVFYKTQGMKKPKFLHLKGFDEDPFTCDENILVAWLEIKHKLDVN